jgi:hypothetical protein
MAVDMPPPRWQSVCMSSTATRNSVAIADLVGVSELASRARVKVGTVQTWRARHPEFPRPILDLAAGPIWAWPDVAAWLETPRPTGRPPRIRP